MLRSSMFDGLIGNVMPAKMIKNGQSGVNHQDGALANTVCLQLATSLAVRLYWVVARDSLKWIATPVNKIAEPLRCRYDSKYKYFT